MGRLRSLILAALCIVLGFGVASAAPGVVALQSWVQSGAVIGVSQLSGLGTGGATFLGTPSGTNALAFFTDETGTGVPVFNLNPTIASVKSDGTHTQTFPTSTGTLALTSDIALYALSTSVQTYVRQINGGRLSLTSGSVGIADVAGATKIYYTPFRSNQVATYDTSQWTLHTFPELAGALGTLTGSLPYDATLAFSMISPSSTNTSTDIVTTATHGFLSGTYATVASTACGLTVATDYWLNVPSSTTFSFHTSLANALAGTSKVDLTSTCSASVSALSLHYYPWTNITTRATALSTQDGMHTVSGERYLGVFYTTATTTTEDSETLRGVWNEDNRVRRLMRYTDPTDSWSYGTAAIRASNNNAAARLQYVTGDAAQFVSAGVCMPFSGVGALLYVGIGVDTTTTFTSLGGLYGGAVSTSSTVIDCASYHGYPGPGFHFLSNNERGGSGTPLIYGDAGDNTLTQSGIFGEIWN